MEYVWRKGIIEQARSQSTGNLFRCRIQPDMEGIDFDLLPLYPNFFKSFDIAYQDQNEVMVLCTEDYQVGYIMGLYQPPFSDNIENFVQLVNVAEKDAGFPISGFNEISILRVANSSITFINTVTGQSGTVTNLGYASIVSPEGDIYVKNPNFKLAVDSKGDVSLQGKSLNTTALTSEEHYTISNEDGSSKSIELSGKMKTVAGGDIQETAGGNLIQHTSQNQDVLVAKKKTETIGLGEDKKIAAGGSSTEVLAGSYSISVVAGSINIMAGAGTINLVSGIMVNVKAPSVFLDTALLNAPQGGAVTGIPFAGGPFCLIPVCPMTGAPHQGNTYVSAEGVL